MAFKLVALFRRAENEAAASDKDNDRQVEFLKSLPGAERVTVGKVTGSPRGESPFSRIIEVHFKDKATGQAALTSQDVRAKAQKMFSGVGKVKMVYVEEE